MKEPNRSTKGDVCVICKGQYDFPSQEARGIYPHPLSHPNVFICWECVLSLVKKLIPQILNESYKQLFLKE